MSETDEPHMIYVLNNTWTAVSEDMEVWHNFGYPAELSQVLAIAAQPHRRRVTDGFRAMARVWSSTNA